MTTRWRLKFGKVISDVHFDPKKKPKRAIVLAYGLLGSPPRKDSPVIDKLVSKGFMVWSPHFIGTFASDGLCTFENSASTLYQIAKAIKEGKGVELWGNSKVRWKVNEIILVGSSFGGTAALIAGAKSKHVQKIISLAGPTDYVKLWKHREGKSFVSTWKRGWVNTWRSTQAHWERFIRGYVDFNPIDYVDQLRERSVLLVHDKRDKLVPVSHSTEFYDKIKSRTSQHKLLLTNNGNHFGIGDLADPKIFPQVLRWLK